MDDGEFTVLHYTGARETKPKWSHAGYVSQWAAEVAAQWAVDYGPTEYAQIVNEDDEIVQIVGDPEAPADC